MCHRPKEISIHGTSPFIFNLTFNFNDLEDLLNVSFRFDLDVFHQINLPLALDVSTRGTREGASDALAISNHGTLHVLLIFLAELLPNPGFEAVLKLDSLLVAHLTH